MGFHDSSFRRGKLWKPEMHREKKPPESVNYLIPDRTEVLIMDAIWTASRLIIIRVIGNENSPPTMDKVNPVSGQKHISRMNANPPDRRAEFAERPNPELRKRSCLPRARARSI